MCDDEPDKKMRCPVCDSTLSDLYRLSNHISEPEGIREDAYCADCHLRMSVHKHGYVHIRKEGADLTRAPKVIPRRPLDDDKPRGYLESDRDWVENNLEAVLWLLSKTLKEQKKYK